MKKISAHSKTSLFLMEIDLCSAFSGTFQRCLYPYSFAAAKNNHIQAQEWRHIQTHHNFRW